MASFYLRITKFALLGSVFLHLFAAAPASPNGAARAAQGAFWVAAGLVVATAITASFMIDLPADRSRRRAS